MTHSKSRHDTKPPRLRGVAELPESHGAHRYRVRISQGQGRQVNLGLYPDRWLAAFAYNVAAEALHGDGRPRNAIPESEQPDADQVRAIVGRVRRRLGLDAPHPTPPDRPPVADHLALVFEITVVGYWREQAAVHDTHPVLDLEIAARRLLEAAEALFWCHSAGHPTPLEVMTRLLARRLDQAFRRSDLTREVLDDDADDPLEVARWLVYPDERPGGGFRRAIARLYSDLLGPDAADPSSFLDWAAVLGIAPPFSSVQVRSAYRTLSKDAHPDI